MQVEDEIEILKNKKFLFDNENSKHIFQLHTSRLWAEVFWRRKQRHNVRYDPEISFILQRQPKTILEIGAGYGRILKKIVEKFLDLEIAEKQTIS